MMTQGTVVLAICLLVAFIALWANERNDNDDDLNFD